MGRVARLALARALFCLAVPLLPALGASKENAAAPREYQVKAAFLYNFARFVEWPAAAFASPQEPLTICVFGDDPFGSDLSDAVKGKTAGAREILIRRTKHSAAAGGCQMAFIGSVEKKYFRPLLDNLTAAASLTVGDSAGFTQAGGVINLVLEGASVRFEINVDAAERAHLTISSALLGLAKIVRDGGNPK